MHQFLRNHGEQLGAAACTVAAAGSFYLSVTAPDDTAPKLADQKCQIRDSTTSVDPQCRPYFEAVDEYSDEQRVPGIEQRLAVTFALGAAGLASARRIQRTIVIHQAIALLKQASK